MSAMNGLQPRKIQTGALKVHQKHVFFSVPWRGAWISLWNAFFPLSFLWNANFFEIMHNWSSQFFHPKYVRKSGWWWYGEKRNQPTPPLLIGGNLRARIVTFLQVSERARCVSACLLLVAAGASCSWIRPPHLVQAFGPVCLSLRYSLRTASWVCRNLGICEMLCMCRYYNYRLGTTPGKGDFQILHWRQFSSLITCKSSG